MQQAKLRLRFIPGSPTRLRAKVRFWVVAWDFAKTGFDEPKPTLTRTDSSAGTQFAVALMDAMLLDSSATATGIN